jgi:hypothetical protein
MSNSDSENSSYIELNRQSADLTALPIDDPNWSKADGIFLQENNISELNADLLPRGLKYLDMSENPITNVYGKFPEGLTSLVLTSTRIEKLGSLPDTLTELVINATPLARKYGIHSDIRNKDIMKKVSDLSFEPGTIMVDNTPEAREIESNSENNISVNYNSEGGSMTKAAYNSDDTRHLVMIIEEVEEPNDIKYRVQTLNEGEKLLFRQHLEPYEPKNANEIKPSLPAIYTKEGHGEDILFEQPVPPGCIYVTIEECGILSSNWGKLLFAFEDKPAGIRDKLRDPVKYKYDLMAHFGRSFHVHYPEAELHGDRTYVDCIHYPFLAWNREKCQIGKSGVLSLDDNNVFVDPSIKSEKSYDEEQVLKTIDCSNISDDDLHKLLDGSKFPTYEMIRDDLEFVDKPITYRSLKDAMDKYAFTQSWSFKMFPGIHYNFSCRDIAKHPSENERIGKRRRNSLAGRLININTAPNNIIKGQTGFDILKGYVRAGITDMIPKMIEKGVDVNRKDEDGKTLLQYAAGKFMENTVKELLKVDGIDKSGAVQAIEETAVKLIEKASDEKKIKFRKEAGELIALIQDTPVKGGRRKKTRVRSRRVRKTRRVKRFK